MVTKVIFLLTAVIVSVVAQAPIPNRPPGFVYKSAPDALVVFEAFVDLICPDSRNAWQTYQAVADHYGQKLQFSALFFPLPYHRAAMMAAQGAFLAKEMDEGRTYRWFDNVFEKQDALYDNEIYRKTQEYIVETLAKWAGEVGYNRSEFESRLARSDVTQTLARVEFKYGGTRGVFETPQTFINGVSVDSEPTWSLEDWMKILDPLMSASSHLEQPLEYTPNVIQEVRNSLGRDRNMIIFT